MHSQRLLRVPVRAECDVVAERPVQAVVAVCVAAAEVDVPGGEGLLAVEAVGGGEDVAVSDDGAGAVVEVLVAI